MIDGSVIEFHAIVFENLVLVPLQLLVVESIQGSLAVEQLDNAAFVST